MYNIPDIKGFPSRLRTDLGMFQYISERIMQYRTAESVQSLRFIGLRELFLNLSFAYCS